jgi:hypothetical protein
VRERSTHDTWDAWRRTVVTRTGRAGGGHPTKVG